MSTGTAYKLQLCAIAYAILSVILIIGSIFAASGNGILFGILGIIWAFCVFYNAMTANALGLFITMVVAFIWCIIHLIDFLQLATRDHGDNQGSITFVWIFLLLLFILDAATTWFSYLLRGRVVWPPA